MPLVGGTDLTGTAFGNPTDFRFSKRPYRATPTGLLGPSNSKRSNFRFHRHRLKLKRKLTASIRISFRCCNYQKS
eukprot:4424058-Pleurochrysis_carterae.AAC.2